MTAVASESTAMSAKGIIIVSKLLKFVAKGLLNELWGMIDALQMVVFLPLVPVPFPGNAQEVFGVLWRVCVLGQILHIYPCRKRIVHDCATSRGSSVRHLADR